MKYQFILSVLFLIISINLNAQARDPEPALKIDETQANLFRENYNKYAIHFTNGKKIRNGYKIKREDLEYELTRFDESKLHFETYKRNSNIAGILSLPYTASFIMMLTAKKESVAVASGGITLGLFIPMVIFGIKSSNAMFRAVHYYNRDVAIFEN